MSTVLGAGRARRRLLAVAVSVVVLAGVAIVGAIVVGPLAPPDGAAAVRGSTGDPGVAATWRPVLVPDADAIAGDVPPPPVAASELDAELEAVRQLQAAPLDDASAGSARAWAIAPVQRWNRYLLEVIRKARPNPVRAARWLAMLNAAMYDSIIASTAAKERYVRPAPRSRAGSGGGGSGAAAITEFVPPESIGSYPSTGAAIATAAELTLTSLLPDRTAEIREHADEARRSLEWAGIASASDVTAGVGIGTRIGRAAVERGRTDGADAKWTGTMPDFPGAWRPIPPAPAPGLEPMAGTWKTWLLPSPGAVRPPPPPAYGSPEWQKEADEVVAVAENLTPGQVEIARFWSDGPGTDTPPGHWDRIALELIDRDGLGTALAARILVHLSMAQADAFIACWEAKYVYWSGRPVQLIPGFASTILTPNFPSYISGHATQSGAAATVLGAFFPGDAGRLKAMSEEAALSRLYGGIHFRSDNEVGLSVGTKIGTLAVDRARADTRN